MRRHQVEAVAGWHLSALREVLAPRIAPHVPYVYSALYEGGERTPGVFLTGETPAFQLRPAIRWLRREPGVRRWTVVGDDYVWPRRSAARAHRYLAECGGDLVDGGLRPARDGRLPGDPGAARPQRRRRGADAAGRAGRGAVQPAFAAYGLDERCRRLSPLITEDMLLAWARTRRAASTRPPVLRVAGHPEQPGLRRALHPALRCRRPVPEQPGRVLLRGRALLAELVTRAGSIDVRSVCAAGRHRALRGGPRPGAAAGQPPRAAGVPRRGPTAWSSTSSPPSRAARPTGREEVLTIAVRGNTF